MTLPELIEALEKATGTSRDLDAQAHIALGLAGEGARSWGPYLTRTLKCPSYTASVDAAIALCERIHPNFNWAISKTGAHVFAGVDVYSGRSTTTAIAIVLATLRAKLSQEKNSAAE